MLIGDPKSRPGDRLADRGDVGVGREAHLPALEIDGNRRGPEENEYID